MNINEFKGYLIVDKNSLDQEIMQHPELLFRIAEAYVEAAANRDACKEALATIDAQLDTVIREELEGEKVTEAMVKNRVQTHSTHKEASDAYLAAKQEADVLAALKDSFMVRGHMLRDLVQLHVTNYWENTSIVGADPEHRRQRQRLANARERRE